MDAANSLKTEGFGREAFESLSETIKLTGGLTLSQLCEITSLESTTVQNWVKRGWVEAPKARRYGEFSVARVLLLNSMRGAMQLDDIVMLMASLNGRVDDRSDDIIPDSELYNHLSAVTALAGESTDGQLLEEAVDKRLEGYTEPKKGAKAMLREALLIMAYACRSTELAKITKEKYNNYKENYNVTGL